ncbi:MAG: HNH endonuclease [bacterium]|nr:HNH endonuclease [bacterium]
MAESKRARKRRLKRRREERKGDVPHRQKQRERLWKRQKQRCAYCRRSIPLTAATLDHVIPRAAGGSGRIGNLVVACGPCNQRKADRMPG